MKHFFFFKAQDSYQIFTRTRRGDYPTSIPRDGANRSEVNVVNPFGQPCQASVKENDIDSSEIAVRSCPVVRAVLEFCREVSRPPLSDNYLETFYPVSGESFTPECSALQICQVHPHARSLQYPSDTFGKNSRVSSSPRAVCSNVSRFLIMHQALSASHFACVEAQKSVAKGLAPTRYALRTVTLLDAMLVNCLANRSRPSTSRNFDILSHH